MTEDYLRAEVGKLRNEMSLLREELAFVRSRLSSYLGAGIALTYLADETPIYVNSNDFGPPANLISGGRYEEDNLAVLLRFVRDDSVFLDIGANLGVYSLLVARRLHGFGKIHAFEPHPLLQDLLWRSAFLNGFRDTVQIHRFGLSDRDATLQFAYPRNHLGGGGVVNRSAPSTAAVSPTLRGNTKLQLAKPTERLEDSLPQQNEMTTATLITASVRRLDDVFDSEFSCDLMKIDVEGHELQVLRGMPRVIGNSPRLKILFENLSDDSDTKNQIETLLRQSRFCLYEVGSNASLHLLGQGELARSIGYVIAARDDAADMMTSGIRFSIYPRQMFHSRDTLSKLSQDRLVAAGGPGQLLFYGPYWFLPRGIWRLRVHGLLSGDIAITIATRFGHKVAEFQLGPETADAVFISEHDLVYFECVGRGVAEMSEVSIERIELIREG